MELENEIICVLSEIGIKIEKLDDANGLFIERENNFYQMQNMMK